MPEKPRILVCDPLPEGALAPLKDKGWKVDLNFKLPQEELPHLIGSYDAVIVRSGIKITADVLKNPGKLKVIARAGVGYDNIDVDAASTRGVIVLNTPEGNTIAAAELTMAHLLDQARHLSRANQSVTEGKWEKGKFIGTELLNSTLGIVGLGKIGSAVARRASAFEMRIVGYDPIISLEKAAEMGVELLSLEGVINTSDFITLHVPLTKETRHLINRETLQLFQSHARLINVARGDLVDTEAMVEAIEEGRLGGAGLDVFPDEPNIPESIRSNSKITKTPHLGASTRQAQDRVALEASQGVIDVLEGRLPKGAVNLPPVSADSLRQLAPFVPVTEGVTSLARWFSGGRRIKQIEAYFLGEIGRMSDLTPLRAALVRGLVQWDQPVNMVNYKEVESQMGLRIREVKTEINGPYRSSVKLCLTYHGTNEKTAVTGIHADGPTSIIGINDYPVKFTYGLRPVLFCISEDKPGIIGTIATQVGQLGINIDEIAYKASLSGERSAMTVLVLEQPLSEPQLADFQNFEKEVFSSIRQFIP